MKKKEPPSSCTYSKRIQNNPQDAVYSQVQLRQLRAQSNVARFYFRSFRLKQANCIINRKKNEECLFSISKLSFRLHCRHKRKKKGAQLCISQQAGGSMGQPNPNPNSTFTKKKLRMKTSLN